MDNPEGLTRKNKILFLVAFIGVVFTGIFAAVYKYQIEKPPLPEAFLMNLDASELQQLINQSCACMPIIDISTPVEYATGHLNNSININFLNTSFMPTIQQFDKTSPIVIYCKGGSRSANASIMLRDDGFRYIYVLVGGINSWIAEGYSV